MSAYVEIIFDNSDDRFPTGKPEVILRRTIGLKKDEYSLDRKNATKADVMNLLESAGFSRSNPYYIVPQGRVTTLTNMKDGERLNLLKEVAGTQVYEARRSESLKIMAETNNKRAKVDEVQESIKERLDELEEEKEELRAFQEKDRERRCLEYTIYHREQQEIQNALDSIDELRQEGVDVTDDNRDRFVQGEQELADIDGQINELRQRIDFLKVDKQQLDDERRDTVRDRAKIELDVKALTEGQSAAKDARSRHESELHTVQEQIRQREAELAQILPQYNKKRDQESALKAQLDDAEGTRQRLYAKQGRAQQFKNKAQRDQFLKNEIQQINEAFSTRKAVAVKHDEEIAHLTKQIERLDTQLTALRSNIEGRGDSMQSISEDVQKAKEARDSLQDQRKELWREEAKLDSVISNAEQELQRAERFLSTMMDHNTSRGIASVRRIKQQYNLKGVYGTLAELFEVGDRYKTAVEVTAGGSLFHYIVDTDDTASRVLDLLNKEKGGRVTFMPLNRLRPRPVNIPKASDAVHMVSKIEYDPMYDKAFQQVFGKTIICPNLQVAAQYARSHGVSAITPEGDRADKKGALTGGYHDPRQSRLDFVRNVLKWRNELETQRENARTIRRSLDQKDQEITRAVSELQKIEQKRMQMEGSYGPMRQELRSLSLDLQNKRDGLEAKQRSKENLESALHELGEQQASYEAELKAAFNKSLTDEEERQLDRLSSAVQDFRRQYSELNAARLEFEGRKAMLEVELRENLRMRLEQLLGQDIEGGGAGGVNGQNTLLKERQRELKRISKTIEELESRLKESERSIDEATSQLQKRQQAKIEAQQQQEEVARTIERQQKRMEKSMAKKALLTEKAAECAKNIRDLGVLPEEAFEKYRNLESDKVNTISTVLFVVHSNNRLGYQASP